MELDEYTIHGFTVIRVLEPVTMHTSLEELDMRIRQLVEAGVTRCAVAFTAGSYFSSRSIAVLIHFNELLRDTGGVLVILHPTEQIRDLLDILGIYERFTLVAAEDELSRL